MYGHLDVNESKKVRTQDIKFCRLAVLPDRLQKTWNTVQSRRDRGKIILVIKDTLEIDSISTTE